MRAGTSKRDVTVPELLGNPIVHDPLFARALVLDDGANSVALYRMLGYGMAIVPRNPREDSTTAGDLACAGKLQPHTFGRQRRA